MTTRRHPAVSGSFYPTSAALLRATVEVLVADAVALAGRAPKAVIAPHAGYDHSGAVAASAYAAVASRRGKVERVVVIGPAHYVPLDGIATTHACAFTTPLGDAIIDGEAVANVERLAGVRCNETAHAPEHSIEVHLPFVQVVLGDVQIVPILVGETAGLETLVSLLDVLWGGDETFIVVSSDLSHYRDRETARRLDEATTRAIERLDAAAIGEEDACGSLAVRGLLVAARSRSLEVTASDVRSSAEIVGLREEIVGYGSFVFA